MARLTREQDAFGGIFWDLHQGRTDDCIIERDDGYVESLTVRAYFTTHAEWSPRTRQAIRLVRGRVLDVGCGAGRHALYLQEKGHEVVGIDESPLAVRVCRERGVKDARVLSLTQVSRKLGVFDTVITLGNNFGLVGNPRRARWWLRRLCGMTSDTARILAEARDPYPTRMPEHLTYHRRNRRRGRMAGQLTLRVRYRKLATPWFDLLLLSPEEMREIAAGTGWQVARVIEDDAGMYCAVLEKERGA